MKKNEIMPITATLMDLKWSKSNRERQIPNDTIELIYKIETVLQT